VGEVGVGIIGSGFMGRTWSAAVSRTLGARRAAIAGGTRAPALAADYHVPALTPGALLADPGVRLILITTPPRSHVDFAIAAVQAGRHVLIEKPMANTAADCDRIIEAARANDVRVGVVSQHRFRKSPLAAKRVIDDGGIGEVRMIRVIGPTAGYDAPDDKWKFDPAEQTVYADWAAHACDITRWFAGSRPVLAFAAANSFTPEPPPQQSIIDSYGAVRLGKDGAWRTIYEQPGFNPTDPLNPVRIQAYGDLLADVIAAIAQGREPRMSGTEGRSTIEMVEAGERSIRTGQAVRLPLDS
jgi:predicted dehydrogenase